jgi:hypothetical protein
MNAKSFSSVLFVMFAYTGAALAAGASNDWSESYQFPSSSDKSLVLIQADLIKRAESDYYDSFGKATYNSNITYNLSNDYSEETNVSCGDNTICDLSSTSTSTIATQNNNNVTVDGNNNSVSTQLDATNTGSINAGINSFVSAGTGAASSTNIQDNNLNVSDVSLRFIRIDD